MPPIFLSLSGKRLKETRLVSRRRDSSRCGRSISPNRLVVGSLLSVKGGWRRGRKKWEKGGKAMCKGVSRVELSHGGDTETSLSGAETTGPRTSRGPDSTLALFSLYLSIYLFLSLTSFFIVSHSPCSHTTSVFLSPPIFVSLKVHPDRLMYISRLRLFSN